MSDEEVASDSDTEVGRALGGFSKGWWREEWSKEDPNDPEEVERREVVFRYRTTHARAQETPDGG